MSVDQGVAIILSMSNNVRGNENRVSGNTALATQGDELHCN